MDVHQPLKMVDSSNDKPTWLSYMNNNGGTLTSRHQPQQYNRKLTEKEEAVSKQKVDSEGKLDVDVEVTKDSQNEVCRATIIAKLLFKKSLVDVVKVMTLPTYVDTVGMVRGLNSENFGIRAIHMW